MIDGSDQLMTIGAAIVVWQSQNCYWHMTAEGSALVWVGLYGS